MRHGILDRLDVRILLGLFAALLVAAVWGVTLARLAKLREGELANATREAAGLARVFEKHAARTVDAAALYLLIGRLVRSRQQALAAGLVELMGGRMALRLLPGRGATFSFALLLGATHAAMERS